MNYLNDSKIKGSNWWHGYECFKTIFGRDGKPFPDGPKYVIFKDGKLVCEKSSESAAVRALKAGETDGFLKSEYLGIDPILRH